MTDGWTDTMKFKSTRTLICDASENKESEFRKSEGVFAIVSQLHVYAKMVSITTHVLTASSVTTWILSASKNNYCNDYSETFDLG